MCFIFPFIALLLLFALDISVQFCAREWNAGRRAAHTGLNRQKISIMWNAVLTYHIWPKNTDALVPKKKKITFFILFQNTSQVQRHKVNNIFSHILQLEIRRLEARL